MPKNVNVSLFVILHCLSVQNQSFQLVVVLLCLSNNGLIIVTESLDATADITNRRNS